MLVQSHSARATNRRARLRQSSRAIIREPQIVGPSWAATILLRFATVSNVGTWPTVANRSKSVAKFARGVCAKPQCQSHKSLGQSFLSRARIPEPHLGLSQNCWARPARATIQRHKSLGHSSGHSGQIRTTFQCQPLIISVVYSEHIHARPARATMPEAQIIGPVWSRAIIPEPHLGVSRTWA
jgi:hypothetical protein